MITRGERRRRWSIEEKRAIVAESLEPGIRPAEITRRHGITSGQLYSWRHQLARRLERKPAAAASFARVDVWSGEPQVEGKRQTDDTLRIDSDRVETRRIGSGFPTRG